MPTEGRDLEASLARILQELEHLKEGLGLLGVKQCMHCRNYFRSEDGGALFDSGQLICYGCLQDWWLQHSPTLRTEQRQNIEHKLLRWLVAHHAAKVIRAAKKLPQADRIEIKLVVACDQCSGTGKGAVSGECQGCEGRGSVWVVGLRPELQ